MKTLFQFKSITLVILFVFISNIAFSQNYKTTESLEKSAATPKNVTIRISNYSADLKISTSDINTIKIITSVEISGKTKEDVEKILEAIEHFEFKQNGNEMEIDTRFYKNMQSLNNRRTITLLNGTKVKIRELNIRHELQIPKSANIVLNNKYSDIEMQSLAGSADFELYSSKLHVGNISNNVQVKTKYSKLYFKEVLGDMDLDLYDSDIEFITAKNVKIKSKYSKVEAEKVEDLDLDSYDDKFYIDEISNLKFEAKYSDLVSEAELTKLELDLYDSNIEINSAKIGTFSGKYSDLKLGNVKELKIANSYDSNIYFEKTMDIQIDESKYSKYEFNEVSKFSIDGYNDNISISELNSEFSGISVKGKYMKLEVNTRNVPFQLAFKIKYPKIDIPESVKTIKHIEKNSELELTANDTGGLISVEGYNMKVVIR